MAQERVNQYKKYRDQGGKSDLTILDNLRRALTVEGGRWCEEEPGSQDESMIPHTERRIEEFQQMEPLLTAATQLSNTYQMTVHQGTITGL